MTISYRNIIIGYSSNSYQINHISTKTIKKNEKVEVDYDFESVSTVSTRAVISSRMSEQALPVVGGIAIPELKINLPIFKGVDNTALTYGAVTLKESQVMGGENNYALASHHVFDIDNASAMLFPPLDHAQPGMRIYVTDKTMVYTYSITDVKTVRPNQVEVIDDVPGKKLVTLITCTDANATGRIVVTGHLVHQIAYSKASKSILEAFSYKYNQI